jgi:hypothetical protein
MTWNIFKAYILRPKELEVKELVIMGKNVSEQNCIFVEDAVAYVDTEMQPAVTGTNGIH